MKNLTILILLTLLAIHASAKQDKYSYEKFKYKNTAQIELMGLGAAYSLNYERNVVNLAHVKISFQLGAAYLPPSTGWINLHFPVSINQLISFNRHHIELGIATMFTFSEVRHDAPLRDYDFENFLAVKIGYRYQKPNGRMQYKILFTPVIEYEHHNEFTPWGGITIGYNF
ncbi:MAG: hypothetical protein WC756_07435 [Taibaiella sp.]|jgi:hypothetical protein